MLFPALFLIGLVAWVGLTAWALEPVRKRTDGR